MLDITNAKRVKTKVIAKDRQTKNFLTYIHPLNFTTPQYNASLDMININNNILSLGLDHMKYVVQNNQIVKCNGYIYNNNYHNTDVVLKKGFLLLEHTDGLNYLNLSLKKILKIYKGLSTRYGFGTGIIVPKTNAIFLDNERHDKYNIAGYTSNNFK